MMICGVAMAWTTQLLFAGMGRGGGLSGALRRQSLTRGMSEVQTVAVPTIAR